MSTDEYAAPTEEEIAEAMRKLRCDHSIEPLYDAILPHPIAIFCTSCVWRGSVVCE